MTTEGEARRVIKIQPTVKCSWPQGFNSCIHRGSDTLECKAPESYYQRCKHLDDENDDNED